LQARIKQVWAVNLQVYGADKGCKQTNREGVVVARCTVERLMRGLGLRGVRRGKVVRTTVGHHKAPCPLDKVHRQFSAERPNPLWVSDFTYADNERFEGALTSPSRRACIRWSSSNTTRRIRSKR
jgi:transposase InsO family protein